MLGSTSRRTPREGGLRVEVECNRVYTCDINNNVLYLSIYTFYSEFSIVVQACAVGMW